MTEALLIGLTAWRVAHLLVYEDGPFDVFAKLRDRIIPVGLVEGFWPRLFSCMWCMTVWTALGSYFAYEIARELVIIGAAAAIAALLIQFSDKR